MAIPIVGSIWQLARRVENIFQDVEKLVDGMKALRDELHQLEKRVTTLEGREELLVEKARGAASSAASAVVMQSVADIARRVGALEAGQGTQRRIE